MTSYRRKLAVSALGGLLAAPPMAGAVEVLGGDLSANIGVVSNYFFRGVTQTDDKAAVQGGLDWVHGTGIYVGTWLSNVDFESDGVDKNGEAFKSDANYELDLYAGWDFDQWLPENFSLGINTIYYAYPDSQIEDRDPDGNGINTNQDEDIDYYEIGASAGWRWISAGVQYTVWGDVDDGPYQDGDVYYYAGLDFELPKGFAIGGLIGYSDFDDDDFANEYTHWSVTLSKDAGKFGTFSLNYEQTDGDRGDDPADDDDPKLWVGWNVTFE